jgi:phosphoglycerol transferase MdoB-like AlkP superfamily enzyme
MGGRTEMITTIELLNFLTKAQKVSPSGLTIKQTDEGYKITLYCDWHDDNDFYQQSVLISNEGASNWNDGAYDFHTMNDILDEMLEKEEQKKIKAQKRKELIARMSDEDKELLGLK